MQDKPKAPLFVAMILALAAAWLSATAHAQLGGNDDVFHDGLFVFVVWSNSETAQGLALCNHNNAQRCYIKDSTGKVKMYTKQSDGSWGNPLSPPAGTTSEDPTQTQCTGGTGICFSNGTAWAGTQWHDMYAWTPPGVGGCQTTVWGCSRIVW